jgi:chromate transporter
LGVCAAIKRFAGALSSIAAAVVGVILNLVIWFAVHSVFREVRPVRGYGLKFDAPVLLTIDPWAFALSVAAVLAIFRFKVEMFSMLAACSLVGIALHVIGAIP